jgi:hypothetical protein
MDEILAAAGFQDLFRDPIGFLRETDQRSNRSHAGAVNIPSTDFLKWSQTG